MTEGFLNDEPFVNHSQFGAFPVQVEGHTHLHDSLEAATVNNEMQQEVRFSFIHVYKKMTFFSHFLFKILTCTYIAGSSFLKGPVKISGLTIFDQQVVNLVLNTNIYDL